MGILLTYFLLSQSISKFFNSDAIGVREISSINLIIQASQAKLTDEQCWVFKSVLDIFGKDVEENIRYLCMKP